MPHCPVFYPQNPKKVRVQSDAAATFKEKSLNCELYIGTDLLISLIDVLIRLQNLRTALVADELHQVKVQKADMDSLRFLWMEEIIPNTKLDTYQITVHIFGATDSSCHTNYTLKSVAKDNFSRFNPLTIKSQ